MKNTTKQSITFNRDIFVKAGKKGGSKTAERGKDYYKEIGSKGGKKRWSKKEDWSKLL